MSFLNPVSEPVLRFKSTDAGAPQINYNARVAGDVKAVLKACLVTGYGNVASAGWAAVNEIGNVIEFVSPSAAMIDYRLGIDDGTATKTVWFYQYQDVIISPLYNSPVKSFTYADKVNVANGWQLFVTERGIVFVEIVQHTKVSNLSARITYWGAVKSAIPSVSGKNICFFNIGHNGAIAYPYYFYASSGYVHTALEDNTDVYVSTATGNALSRQAYALDTSIVDLVSPIYIASSDQNMLVGELPPILSKIVNSTPDVYSVKDSILDSRPVFSVTAGRSDANTDYAISFARTFLIKADYWEY